MRLAVAIALLTVIAAGCTSTSESTRTPDTAASPPASGSGPTAVPDPTGPTPTRSSSSPSTSIAVRPADFDQKLAMAAVRHLAGEIGPRQTTGPQFRRAAAWVERRFSALGFEVTRQSFEVPAGDSWGVPVSSGQSRNVIARPVGFDPRQPYLIVGAHLDTVAPAPGAEDNASGVGVLLAAAAASAQARTRLPVVWIAFGAEEPRGPGDGDHHYGSRAYVEAVSPAERRSLRAFVSLDRVGVGRTVPVGSAGDGDPVQRKLLAAAGRAQVPAVAESFSRSSDHWSFVRAGLPGARLGSTPYAAYHSSRDLPDVVDPAQLGRTGRLLLAWLAPSP